MASGALTLVNEQAAYEARLKPRTTVIPYEKRLAMDARWALSEGSKFFEGKSKVQSALRKVTQRLQALDIPYAVVGGLALSRHGYVRFTDDVDILVTPQGLQQIHARLEGLGYLPPHKGSKNLRDTDSGVKIEFLVTGDFPGDGKPKPVSFPDPSAVAGEYDGIRYLNLATLIELKLASGMSAAHRLKDIADVIELIKLLKLERVLADQLNPYVQDKYRELWDMVRESVGDEPNWDEEWAQDPEASLDE